MDSVPTVSIIIRTTGENHKLPSLAKLLKLLSKQTVRFHELIVSTETNRNLIEHLIRNTFPKLNFEIKVLEIGAWNRCITTNKAILRSKGEIIVVLEDDIILDKLWLERVLWVFREMSCYNVGCVFTEFIVPRSRSLLRKKGIIGKLEKRSNIVKSDYLHESLTIPITCFACKRQALIKVGLFDEALTEPMRGDDYELGFRLFKKGYRILALREVRAIHATEYGSKYLRKPPEFWKNFFKTEMYTYAKHYDLLGIYIFSHMLYMIHRSFSQNFKNR